MARLKQRRVPLYLQGGPMDGTWYPCMNIPRVLVFNSDDAELWLVYRRHEEVDYHYDQAASCYLSAHPDDLDKMLR